MLSKAIAVFRYARAVFVHGRASAAAQVEQKRIKETMTYIHQACRVGSTASS